MYKSFSLALLAMFVLPVSAETTAEPSAGEVLHQQHCSSCHGTEVYNRPDRKISDYDALLQRTRMCSANTGANLFEDEIEQVALYLNSSFYKYDQ